MTVNPSSFTFMIKSEYEKKNECVGLPKTQIFIFCVES